MLLIFSEKKFRIDSDDSDSENEELNLNDDGNLLNVGMRQWTRT